MIICFSEPIEVRTLSRSPTYAHIQLISKPKPKLKLKFKPKPTKQYRISPLTRLTVARTSRKRAKLWKTFGWKKRLAVCTPLVLLVLVLLLLLQCSSDVDMRFVFFFGALAILCAMCFTLCCMYGCTLNVVCLMCGVHSMVRCVYQPIFIQTFSHFNSRCLFQRINKASCTHIL